MRIVLTPDEVRFHVLRSLGLAKDSDLRVHSSGLTVLVTPHVVLWEDPPSSQPPSGDIPDDCFKTDDVCLDSGE